VADKKQHLPFVKVFCEFGVQSSDFFKLLGVTEVLELLQKDSRLQVVADVVGVGVGEHDFVLGLQPLFELSILFSQGQTVLDQNLVEQDVSPHFLVVQGVRLLRHPLQFEELVLDHLIQEYIAQLV